MNKKTAIQENPRQYRGEQEIDHDLFKLQPAITRKNMGYSSQQPIWENVEHVHFYHSHDSSGKEMKHSSAVGGHYHPVEWKIVDGKFMGICGKPLTKDDNTGKVNPYKNDEHIHEVLYVRSERIQVRKIDAKVAMAIANHMGTEPSAPVGALSANR